MRRRQVEKDLPVVDPNGVFDELGRLIPDSTPLEVPLAVQRSRGGMTPDLIRAYIQREMSIAAGGSGYETLEESDDFEVDEEGGEFVSPHEIDEMSEDFDLAEQGADGRSIVPVVPEKPAPAAPVVGGPGGNPPVLSPEGSKAEVPLGPKA